MIWRRKGKGGDEESKKALTEAKQNLERIKKRTPEVRAVTLAQQHLLQRNGFIERLEAIMGGH
jgi:vacuolar-type H+-ATPase subunit H